MNDLEYKNTITSKKTTNKENLRDQSSTFTEIG